MSRALLAATLLSSTLLSTHALAVEWPKNVTVVKSEKGKKIEVKGKLEAGAPIADLTWAANSSVACFPATQNEKFRGNHVLFATELPPTSEMTITVVPTDPSADLSIYAYSVGTTSTALPPALPSCVSCEAEHRWDRPKKNRTQDHTRSVKLNAIRNPYNVVIGVTGPATATKGEFTLVIDLK